jgi:hypothetical protein
MAPSSAVYDFLADVLRSRPLDDRRVQRACDVKLPVWRRVVGFEGCAPQIDQRLRASGHDRLLPAPLRQLFREATAESLRLGILAHRQLGEVAALAARSGIRVMALKGAARLLAGQTPGARSIADIDLLVAPADAERFHGLMATELGYASVGRVYAHHLPVLERRGSLNVDLHSQLSDEAIPLDAMIWSETQVVMAGGLRLEVPSPTSMVLHVLEHGLALNWMGRYRLRDVLDVAASYTADVSDERVRRHVATGRTRSSCETLLSAAHELEPRAPTFRADAWRTIRRVSHARLALATLPQSPRVAERWFRYAGLLAEGSPRSLIRAGRSAAQRLGTKLAGVAGCRRDVA